MLKTLFDKIVFRERPWMWKMALVLMLLAGFAIRMYDLTDPPIDFNPTRQLFSALKARGMYYQYFTSAPADQRALAIALGDVGTVEPPVLETIVSQTYRLTGEHLWIARVFSSLFWVLGGLALFLLIREFASSGAAIIGTLVYLFVPFGIVASRAFMPDPLMVALIIFSIWALFRWQNTAKWKWAILFGVFSGLSIFIKNVAVFMVVGAFVGVILGAHGLKRSIRDLQVWVMAVLLVLPTAIYIVYSTVIGSGSLESQLALRFFPQMWLDPAFYFSWQNLMSNATGFGLWVAGIVGVFLADKHRERPLLLGLWIGYILFGFTFPYHFTTHDYYHLTIIPIVALSLAPLVKVVFERFFTRNSDLFPRLILIVLVLFGVAVQSWYARARLAASTHYSEPAFWAEIGDKLGHTASVVGLTQDYGYRLAYWGWQGSSSWFTSADIAVRYMAGQNIDLAKKFAEDTAGKHYFLVTMFSEFDNQPEIKDLLYSHYLVVAKTDEYIIFDLQHPLSQP